LGSSAFLMIMVILMLAIRYIRKGTLLLVDTQSTCRVRRGKSSPISRQNNHSAVHAHAATKFTTGTAVINAQSQTCLAGSHRATSNTNPAVFCIDKTCVRRIL